MKHILIFLFLLAWYGQGWADTIIGVPESFSPGDEILADAPHQSTVFDGRVVNTSIQIMLSQRAGLIKLGGRVPPEVPAIFYATEPDSETTGAYLFARCIDYDQPIMDSLDVAITDCTFEKQWLETGQYYLVDIVAMSIAVYSDHATITDFYQQSVDYPIECVRFWYVDKKAVGL